MTEVLARAAKMAVAMVMCLVVVHMPVTETVATIVVWIVVVEMEGLVAWFLCLGLSRWGQEGYCRQNNVCHRCAPCYGNWGRVLYRN